jgi:putative DNA primase/helicase
VVQDEPALGRKLTSAPTVAAVERLARSDRRHAATVDQWDSDPWSLNTPGGVVDLRTGEVRRATPTDYFTKTTSCAPGGEISECPMWMAFLDRVTNYDVYLQGFLQRVAGYCLTGWTREDALFFFYGTGRNGKSTFLNTLAAIWHDYARSAPSEMFLVSKGERHPTDLAMLRGARLVIASELEDGKRWAEARIKSLTGGDPITARFMRQDFFEFTPHFKLVIAGNHKPSLRAVDEAIRARFHLVPFNVVIPEEQRDKNLLEKLRVEWPAILRWAIEGCLAWQREGLKPPAAVQEATMDYMAAEDTLGRWVDQRCIQGNNCQTSSSALFADYRQWAQENNEWVPSQKVFSTNLEQRGFSRDHNRKGSFFMGIALLTDTV